MYYLFYLGSKAIVLMWGVFSLILFMRASES